MSMKPASLENVRSRISIEGRIAIVILLLIIWWDAWETIQQQWPMGPERPGCTGWANGSPSTTHRPPSPIPREIFIIKELIQTLKRNFPFRQHLSRESSWNHSVTDNGKG
jgi:hypothetical protein